MKNGKKRNHRILVRFLLAFLCIFVPVFILSVFTLVSGFALLIGDTKGFETESMGKYARNQMEEYRSISWLVDYWLTHVKELDIPVDALKDTDSVWYQEHDWVYGERPKRVTEEDLMAMTPEQQKQFAEYCYEVIAENYDYLEHVYTKLDFHCIALTGGNESVILFHGSEKGQPRESYPLGEPYHLSNKRMDMLLNGPPNDIMTGLFAIVEDDDETDELYQVRYAPVKDGDTALCYVEVLFMWDELIHTTLSYISRTTMLVLLIVFTLGFFLLLFVLGFWIIRRIRLLQKAVEAYDEDKNPDTAESHLRKRLKVKRKDELDHLAESFVTLTRDIDGYLEEIQADAIEKEHAMAELSMAAAIQEGQLPGVFPPYPDRKEFSLYAMMDPAKEVGGDFYDFFLIDPDHLALVIADVSDKGVPAALFMMTAKTLIKSTLCSGKTPGVAMEHINRQLCEANAAEMFVTVWLGVLTISTGELVSVNAGHEKPVLFRDGGAWELERLPHDMALAMVEDLTFTEQRTVLHPGDGLFVYTDGVVESTSSDKKLFGNDRMLEALNESPEAEPEALISRMKEKIRVFVEEAEQFDDITMLCVRYFGAQT